MIQPTTEFLNKNFVCVIELKIYLVNYLYLYTIYTI